MIELYLRHPSGTLDRLRFEKDQVRIGRDAQNDVVCTSARVSRDQCVLRRLGDGFEVEDLQSSNGTFVNGFRIQKTKLSPRDVISFDKYDVFLCEVDADRSVTHVEIGSRLTQYHRRVDAVAEPAAAPAAQDRDELQRMRTLYEVGNLLNSQIKIDELLRIIIQEATKHLGFERGFILLKDLETGSLYARTAQGSALQGSPRAQADFSTSVATHVFRTQQPLMIPDTADVMQFREQESILQWRIKSIIAVPLRIRDQATGVLYLDTVRGHREYAEPDLVFLEQFATQAAIALYNASLYELSSTDGLTGVHSRRYFEHQLQMEVKRARRYKTALSVLFIDLDHFKRVNDHYGHLFGDFVLRESAQLLKAQLRETDLLARYGGEEFVALLPQTGEPDAAEIARRLKEAQAAHPFEAEHAPVLITCSIGVASYPASATSERTLLARADRALYASKEGGRDRVTVASSLEAREVPEEPPSTAGGG